MDLEGERKFPSSQEDKNTKRKMKTPTQLELLEKTYADDSYPSEAVRAELSLQLGLSDRQLQMWFCHRRLKDRKVKEEEGSKKQKKGGQAPAAPPPPPPPPPPPAPTNYYDDYPSGSAQVDPRKRQSKSGCEGAWKKKSHAHSPAELRAIAAVEAQLGEPLQEDGPILGVEFDPLPPGAFGTPIGASSGQQNQGHHYESKPFDRQDAKSNKRSSVLQNAELPSTSSAKRKTAVGSGPAVHPQSVTRAPHEYQFLPEQPSGRHDAYERATQSNFYESPFEALGSRVPSLSTPGTFLHGHEQLAAGYGFQSHISNVGPISQEGRPGHVFSQGGVDYDATQHKDSYAGFGFDGQFGSHQAVGSENPYLSSEKRTLYHDQERARMDKKRKSDEARIAKEVEAHEKRIRKELEKQEIMRRKREEQMRKELEKQDREKRKEEERILREKQREEERMQREHRREIERRERILQKENKRAEKMRHKEELRREKEAARMKAANERATARKLARESMELIDDERLELMEAAASAKGLSSIFLLDSETLQELELYKDALCQFPPPSVKMKVPFGARPWTDSEQNVGNILMAWRFIITFADVLGLWPFTLDEFIQAFHDYDSRLLGEIHVALLKTLVKDIEDVARGSSNGLGTNQNSNALSGGGHPQLVEAAYAWGFDIREWHRYLNPLTWPEVLRQFALAVGYGPQWKKRKPLQERPRDENEGHEGEDAVSTLRSGAAAANAVAMMQGKGSGHLRRCRYRLTPGTVKYAAFHVLSLEGSKGLTILEVADRIQKSGLRDLSTSKTPEASIAAALSRDANLFERVAPSTYCVRPAFRKDPCDAEAILQAAREKIQLFQSGFSDSEDAEKDAEDVEDVERDEDYDCDDVEDADTDDLDGPVNSGKAIFCLKEGKVVQASAGLGKEKSDMLGTRSRGSPSPEVDRIRNDKSSVFLGGTEDSKQQAGLKDMSFNVGGNDLRGADVKEETEIDESHMGEPWVQGLMEGEYSDLSVEERLNALISLIGVTNEGNTIRITLEERLEAANALKRQMWAEAQLDKRRLKEEQLSRTQASSFVGIKSEGINNHAAFDGGQSPLLGMDNKGSEASVFTQTKLEASMEATAVQNHCFGPANSILPVEKSLIIQDNASAQDTFLAQQTGYTTERSRAQLKAYIGLRAEELYVYRSFPLGQDRRHNRYWQFVTCASGNDPGSGRIFFESYEDGHWRVIDTEEAFDALLASLDTRGIREAHLHAILQKAESLYKQAVKRHSSLRKQVDFTGGIEVKAEFAERTSYPGCVMEDGSPDGAIIVPATDSAEQSVSFTIELGRNKSENEHALERYTDFEKWLWTECLKSSALNAIKLGKKRSFELLCTCEVCHEVYWSRDKHCSCCHGTFESSHKLEVKFSQHVLDCEEKKRRRDPGWRLQGPTRALPSRIQLLKAEIAAVEASVPYEALKSFWTDAYRKSWGLTLKSATSSAELLQIFTQLEAAVNQDWLSSSFETTKELLSVVSQDSGVDEDLNFGEVTVLPWIPHTTAAVALRLMAFDDALSYGSDKKEHQRTNESEEDFNTVQSNATVVRTIEELEAAENLPQAEEDKKEDTWTDSGNGRSNGRSRGRGRGRGGRGGRGSALRTELGIGCFNKDTKQKLQFFEEGMSVTNEDQKAGRGRARRGRARGRGRGRGTRSVRHRQAGIQQGEKREKDSDHLSSIDIGKHKQVYEEIDEEDQSEDSQSEEGEEWEGQNGFGEAENYADNHHYNDEEDNALESSENEDDIDDACEDRQATDDEFEDEDVKYEDDYYGGDGEVEESEGDEAGEIVVESGDEEEEDDEESSSESSKDSD